MTFSYEIRNELCISDLVKLLKREITELAAMLYHVHCPIYSTSGLDQLGEYSSNCVPNTEVIFEHFSMKLTSGIPSQKSMMMIKLSETTMFKRKLQFLSRATTTIVNLNAEEMPFDFLPEMPSESRRVKMMLETWISSASPLQNTL